ncbi:hypothetical protein Tco_0304554 [Tanacetum coccineum]
METSISTPDDTRRKVAATVVYVLRISDSGVRRSSAVFERNGGVYQIAMLLARWVQSDKGCWRMCAQSGCLDPRDPEEDDIKPGVVLGRSFLRLPKGG